MINILQSEQHNDDLGIIFYTVKGKKGVQCAIDWKGGEMKFKLNFIIKYNCEIIK
jgi:hypothetical protein